MGVADTVLRVAAIEIKAAVYGGLTAETDLSHLSTWQLQQMRRAARLRRRLPWRDSQLEAQHALDAIRRGVRRLRRTSRFEGPGRLSVRRHGLLQRLQGGLAMSNTEFDFARAWRELAKPAFESLPQNVHDLYERVVVEAEGLPQNKELGMDWPEDSSLRSAFDGVPADFLCEASRIIYFYGHTSPSGHSYRGGGGTWKFSIYADQSLEDRLWKGSEWAATHLFSDRYGYGRKPPEPKKRADQLSWLQVCEGVLRICYASMDAWRWVEVAPATLTSLEILQDPNRGAVTYGVGRPIGKLSYEDLDALDGKWLKGVLARFHTATTDYRQEVRR